VECLTSNKRFDFGADLDHDPDPGIFKTELLPLLDKDSCKKAVREAATICPAPCKLTFDLLTLKVVSESRVTGATSVPILVFLCLSVLDLGPMYARDRQTSDAHHRLMPPILRSGVIQNFAGSSALVEVCGHRLLLV